MTSGQGSCIAAVLLCACSGGNGSAGGGGGLDAGPPPALTFVRSVSIGLNLNALDGSGDILGVSYTDTTNTGSNNGFRETLHLFKHRSATPNDLPRWLTDSSSLTDSGYGQVLADPANATYSETADGSIRSFRKAYVYQESAYVGGPSPIAGKSRIGRVDLRDPAHPTLALSLDVDGNFAGFAYDGSSRYLLEIKGNGGWRRPCRRVSGKSGTSDTHDGGYDDALVRKREPILCTRWACIPTGRRP